MKDELQALAQEAREAIEAAQTAEDVEAVRVSFLGRKSGRLKDMLSSLGKLPAEERPVMGQLAQGIRKEIEDLLKAKGESVGSAQKAKPKKTQAAQASGDLDRLDVTLPGRAPRLGKRHPTLAMMDEIVAIFLGLGFKVAEGPEVENHYYGWEALNYPDDHPAMDEQMTFYLANDLMLRSQTSTVQIRTMEQEQPPVAYVVPGRCYRRDRVDATHMHTFYQLEGLKVGAGISFAHLKGTLVAFARELFGDQMDVRLRPDFFPFTEPSAEFALTCTLCMGDGCRTCSGTGWLEVGGCGVVDENVLRNIGYDPEEVSGFAFGFGIDRFAMLRHQIDDIRLLWSGDMRFLRQF
ncbi:MAG TPA: phenylalanine--tRNA ligase subunit alpha [Armatimonadota bacterium]|nr:phenylalanine--tRNA ligase subunit alpha [Armatimonadota bacterium]